MKTLSPSLSPHVQTQRPVNTAPQPTPVTDKGTPQAAKQPSPVEDVMDPVPSSGAPQLAPTVMANHPNSLLALRLRPDGDMSNLDHDDKAELYSFLMKTPDRELRALGERAIDVGEMEVEDHRTRYDMLPQKIALYGLSSILLVVTTPAMPLTLLAMPKTFQKTREVFGHALEGKQPLNLMRMPSYRRFVEALEASATKDTSGAPQEDVDSRTKEAQNAS